MTVSQQRCLLFNSQRSARQTKRGAMMNVSFRLLRGVDRRSQNWRLNQSVNQPEESPAERRARATVFASEFESAELHIQIEPLFDWEPISNPNSQLMSRATEMNFERTNFVKILSQKRFERICAERFLGGESLKSKPQGH